MNKDTPQSNTPYNQRDHYHCWQEEEPPCGIKGKHRCCLCELPVPQSNTDWREEVNSWRMFPDQDLIDYQNNDVEDIKDFISQLLEAEKKRWTANVLAVAPGFQNTKTGEVSYDAGVQEYMARIENLDAVLQKLS